MEWNGVLKRYLLPVLIRSILSKNKHKKLPQIIEKLKINYNLYLLDKFCANGMDSWQASKALYFI